MSPLILQAAQELTPHVGAALACQAVGLNRSSFYRYREIPDAQKIPDAQSHNTLAEGIVSEGNAVTLRMEASRRGSTDSGSSTNIGSTAPTPTSANMPINTTSAPMARAGRRPCSVPGRALTLAERQHILDLLHSERFCDMAPSQVYSTLLDEGLYLCSLSTFYRILRSVDEVHERRNQRTHPDYLKPELLATGPNQVWSWDITKLRGPGKWTYYYLYVILDIYSRCVVGWMVVFKESAALATELIGSTCQKQGIPPSQLTIHADRGSAMTSKPVAFLLDDLGVTKTHSRPHVSNDNPFSEAHFKTLKYRPDFPGSFTDITLARHFCRDFFHWYNTQHHHSGIALLTPETVHYNHADERLQARQKVLDAAYALHPERFVSKPPQQQPLKQAVWINPPLPSTVTEPLKNVAEPVRKEALA